MYEVMMETMMVSMGPVVRPSTALCVVGLVVRGVMLGSVGLRPRRILGRRIVSSRSFETSPPVYKVTIRELARIANQVTGKSGVGCGVHPVGYDDGVSPDIEVVVTAARIHLSRYSDYKGSHHAIHLL